MKNNKIYVTKDVISKPGCEYIFKIDFTSVFKNQEKGIEKLIVDSDGNIMNFPGIDFNDILKEELGRSNIDPVIKYEVSFEEMEENKILMVWTVRPDGRFWMDSWGFGAEDYESVCLYTYLDENGNFTAPFKLHSIGYKNYYEY
ncbi:MAG: hypothetical protein IIX54_04525 [Clostridia bacterium]|nr:hypothetical protein [Clostridia bacterium]